MGLLSGYGMLLITFSCVDTDLFIEGCPRPIEANAISLKQVFYSPYENNHYSDSADTVLVKDFRFNFELEIKEKEMANAFEFPGRAFATSCIPSYSIRNISNISVILLAPFAGLPVGTDIGYLLETPEGSKISELKVFEGVSIYFGTKLLITPQNFSQLKTRTFLFLRDGTQTFIDSTSPFLKIN